MKIGIIDCGGANLSSIGYSINLDMNQLLQII